MFHLIKNENEYTIFKSDGNRLLYDTNYKYMWTDNLYTLFTGFDDLFSGNTHNFIGRASPLYFDDIILSFSTIPTCEELITNHPEVLI